MNQEQIKLIKKYNKIYVIELLVIAVVIIVLATLKLLGIIGSSQNFRHVFNIITIVGATLLIADFVWLCFSKRRQLRNSWLDKSLILPVAIAMIVVDIICFINWDVEVIEWYSPFISIAFYYIAVAYIIQALYHIKKPTPSIMIAALDDYKAQQKEKEEENSKASK